MKDIEDMDCPKCGKNVWKATKIQDTDEAMTIYVKLLCLGCHDYEVLT